MFVVKCLLCFFHLLLSTRFPATGLSASHVSRLELSSQVGSTTDHLPSCCLIQPAEDLSTMRAAQEMLKV